MNKEIRGKMTLEEIVAEYKQKHVIGEKGCFKDYLDLHSITDCVTGHTNNPRKRKDGSWYYYKHPHQWRVSFSTIENAIDALTDIEETLNNAKSFEELHEIVKGVNVKGFGALAKYDFSLRYSLHRNVAPKDFVHTHAGAFTGAKAMRDAGYIKDVDNLFQIPIEAFPSIIRELGAADIENLLCIYKYNF